MYCDFYVFDWLVQFFKASIEPEIETKTAVQILLGADFLGKDPLVGKCLNFVSNAPPSYPDTQPVDELASRVRGWQWMNAKLIESWFSNL